MIQSRHGTDYGPKFIREGGLIEKLTSHDNVVKDYGDVTLDLHPEDENLDISTKNPMTVGSASFEVSRLIDILNEVLYK